MATRLIYFLSVDGKDLNPAAFPVLTTSLLQSKMTFKSPKGLDYTVLAGAGFMDVSKSFKVLLTKKVLSSDMTNFVIGLKNSWFHARAGKWHFIFIEWVVKFWKCWPQCSALV